MKSHTSLVAQQTRLSKWADMVRDCHELMGSDPIKIS